MVRGTDANRGASIPRRKRWNLIEYPGHMPSAEIIARNALRMLRGPRYLRHPSRIGRDVQIQSWIFEWCRGSTGSSWLADRSSTFDALLRETTQRFAAPIIVETGCIRGDEDWGGGGYSTYLFGAYLDGLNAGSLTSVDVSRQNCEFARDRTQLWKSRVRVEQADSVDWLSKGTSQIDVLYLDSLDVEAPEHGEHALAETRAALPLLHQQSLVVFDDTVWNKGWRGKGRLAVPYLLENGWRIESSGYQIVLTR